MHDVHLPIGSQTHGIGRKQQATAGLAEGFQLVALMGSLSGHLPSLVGLLQLGKANVTLPC